jgi:REP element-mobilizing transposase RayT
MDGPQARGYNFGVKQRYGERPPRLSRIFDSSPLYFVTFCTHERRPWLTTQAIHSAFVYFCERAEREFNVAVGRYVIMPEHVHLFVRGGYDFVVGQWMGQLKQALARAAGCSRTGNQVWQEGCFDHVLRSNESYAEKWNYVRDNPVRAGLVARAEDWPYQGEIVYIDRA